MQKRKLGKTGLEVAPLAFGGNVFGWTVDAPTSFQLLDAFVASGHNLIDTADVYSAWKSGNRGGESETIIGAWLKKSGRRDQVVIATKVGMEVEGKQGLSRARILEAAEASLRRLQTDYIDVYQSHRDDENTPLEETLEAYSTLIRQGKVRAIGASNYSAARLSEALGTAAARDLPTYQTLQPLYNLYDRAEFERDLQSVALRHELAVIPYYGLASGFLTGKYRTEADLAKSPRGAGVKKYLDVRGQRILAALDEVSGRLHATPAQVALAWLMTRPAVVAPIASATSLPQLEDLLQASELKLDQAAQDRLCQASHPTPA